MWEFLTRKLASGVVLLSLISLAFLTTDEQQMLALTFLLGNEIVSKSFCFIF